MKEKKIKNKLGKFSPKSQIYKYKKLNLKNKIFKKSAKKDDF